MPDYGGRPIVRGARKINLDPGERSVQVGTAVEPFLIFAAASAIAPFFPRGHVVMDSAFHIRTIRPEDRWAAVLDGNATRLLAVDPSDAARRRLAAREVRVENAPPFRVASDVPAGMAALAGEVLAASLTFERTTEYCRWRYDRHPYLRYAYLWLGAEADPEAAAVLRVEDVSGRPGRVLRVTEFLGH